MADSSHLDTNIITTTDSNGNTSVSVVNTNIAESSSVESVIVGGGRGQDGYTPVKGVDYFDGVDGVNPMTVSSIAPSSPREGDLWYQP